MFDLMNPQLMQMEELRRRQDILAAIRGSVRSPERHRAMSEPREPGVRPSRDMLPASARDSR
jgi:hypothetical protein